MRRIVNLSVLGGLLGLGVLACDAQVDGEYQGEPMVAAQKLGPSEWRFSPRDSARGEDPEVRAAFALRGIAGVGKRF